MVVKAELCCKSTELGLSGAAAAFTVAAAGDPFRCRSRRHPLLKSCQVAFFRRESSCCCSASRGASAKPRASKKLWCNSSFCSCETARQQHKTTTSCIAFRAFFTGWTSPALATTLSRMRNALAASCAIPAASAFPEAAASCTCSMTICAATSCALWETFSCESTPAAAVIMSFAWLAAWMSCSRPSPSPLAEDAPPPRAEPAPSAMSPKDAPTGKALAAEDAPPPRAEPAPSGMSPKDAPAGKALAAEDAPPREAALGDAPISESSKTCS
mmetsp:Transcript_2764/g.5949  ORF Transcript_2764/g.5949 Transcript_2764/m.5949 type:complete len:271 (+) Transcript_2764:1901-2713(+)